MFVCLFVVVVVVLCVCVCVVFGVLSLIPSEVLELLMYKVNHLRIAYLLSIVRMNSNNIVNRGYCCDWKLIIINNYDKIGT